MCVCVNLIIHLYFLRLTNILIKKINNTPVTFVHVVDFYSLRIICIKKNRQKYIILCSSTDDGCTCTTITCIYRHEAEYHFEKLIFPTLHTNTMCVRHIL